MSLPPALLDTKAWRRGRSDAEVVRYVKTLIQVQGTVEFLAYGRTARRQMVRVGYAMGQEGFGVLLNPLESGATFLRLGTKEGLDARAIAWPRGQKRRASDIMAERSEAQGDGLDSQTG